MTPRPAGPKPRSTSARCAASSRSQIASPMSSRSGPERRRPRSFAARWLTESICSDEAILSSGNVSLLKFTRTSPLMLAFNCAFDSLVSSTAELTTVLCVSCVLS